jgi:hypothetical protein
MIISLKVTLTAIYMIGWYKMAIEDIDDGIVTVLMTWLQW